MYQTVILCCVETCTTREIELHKKPVLTDSAARCLTYVMCLNGGMDGGTNGEYTYTSTQGSSVSDYFVCSKDVLSHISMLNVCEILYYDHFPLELKIGR